MSIPSLAILAVLPMITGPLPNEEGRSIVAALCAGGQITIPISGSEDQPKRDCHQKGCHAGNCRRQFDPEQRRDRS